MTKTLSHKRFVIKLPIINLEKPYKIDKPVVMIPEEEYRELLEDIEDLRDALAAEEEYSTSGGKSFTGYDQRRKKNR